jgi:3-deoxy-D-manno-octulosonate 8-phosphate phosphatase (KDO 8-P phosphatase)
MALEQQFTSLGGIFLTSAEKISSGFENVKALVFDWDGVFNDGRKSGDTDGTFSEIDSMGINLLRFDYWLRNNRILKTFIISGMKNHVAADFSKREHFDAIFLNVKNKREALELIRKDNQVEAGEIAFIFDDILDIEVAKLSRLSFFIGRKSNPLLTDYIKQNNICDYISAFSGENNAIREICELLIGLSGDYNRALELRIQFRGEYEKYLAERRSVNTNIVLF